MGCDIHGFCEVKENGVWKLNTKKVFKNPYYLSTEEVKEIQAKDPGYEILEWQRDQFREHPSDTRSYDWFAILANVRNGWGFAGITTGEGFSIIDEPRGVPDDCTPEWKEQVDQWRGDMHSHSYLSVEDFDNFNWNQLTNKQGVIPLDEYKKLAGTNQCPGSWSGGISGPNIITVDEDAAEKILREQSVVVDEYVIPDRRLTRDKSKGHLVSLESGHNIWVLYKWTILYSDWFEYKIESIVKPMRTLRKEYEEVRYVFGFDN